PSAPAALRPTVLYFHGGGFVLGSLDSHDALCHHLCSQSGAQVLAIDYRLAPKHPFPAALDDARIAAKWLCDHADVIHADPARLAIGGDSAGANLATTACRLLHSTDGQAFRYQLLIYPMLDLRLNQPSVQSFGEGYRLTADILRWFVTCYVPEMDRVSDPLISPLLAPDLSSLPASLVLTAGFDPLRDEGLAYAAALRQAGVTCETMDYGDMIHGFCNMPGSLQQARNALAVLGRKLAEALT
ncbi:MAG TPA: alpha/beta hydrolase, partial [Magnetovibrio sp.]